MSATPPAGFRLGWRPTCLASPPSTSLPTTPSAASRLRSSLRTLLPTTELRRPLPGNASAWSTTTRARELLGFVPEYSWRDEG